MEPGLLIDGVNEGSLGTLVGKEGGGQVKFEALGNLVLKFNLTTKDVGSSPGLGEGETMFAVGIFGLDIASDEFGLGVTGASDFEGNIGGSLGLNLERCSVDVVVLAQQVVGGLAKILRKKKQDETVRNQEQHMEYNMRAFQEGGTGWGRDMVI